MKKTLLLFIVILSGCAIKMPVKETIKEKEITYIFISDTSQEMITSHVVKPEESSTSVKHCEIDSLKDLYELTPIYYDDVKSDKDALLMRFMGWNKSVQDVVKRIQKEEAKCQ